MFKFHNFPKSDNHQQLVTLNIPLKNLNCHGAWYFYNSLKSSSKKMTQYYKRGSYSQQENSSVVVWAFNNEFLWLQNIYLVLMPLNLLMK